MKEKKNVLMVGSALNVKGGMTTVVEGFINNKFKKFNLYYIPTHIEASKFKQMVLFTCSFIKIIYYFLLKNISIIHMHFSERGSFTRKYCLFKLAKVFKKKIVIHMHGAEFKEFYSESNNTKKGKILKFLIGADRVIVLGNSWDGFVRSLDKRIKTEVMPNFVKCVDKTVRFNTKEVNILFLAVLIKRKGIFDLVEAIKLLLKDINGYKIKVIIAGTGREENNIKEKIKELGIEASFDFKGWVQNNKKQKILENSQIFVLPSYNEGLPVSILEAMSYGLPIISTNVGSIEDAVIDNYNGTIIKPGDINALKEEMKTLIENKNKWNMYSKNSKDIVYKKYNQENYFNTIENLYKSII
ncbi:glycosyltransferase family 4 protein [Clostridium botulinum]|nr:glycosyltransferase family 4 protein [Clostridium botulinum]